MRASHHRPALACYRLMIKKGQASLSDYSGSSAFLNSAFSSSVREFQKSDISFESTGLSGVERNFLMSTMEFLPSAILASFGWFVYWLVTSARWCRMTPLQTDPKTLRISLLLCLVMAPY